MNTSIIIDSICAFHANGINGLVYNFSVNWCLLVLLAAAVISVVLGVTNESASVVRDEQTIL